MRARRQGCRQVREYARSRRTTAEIALLCAPSVHAIWGTSYEGAGEASPPRVLLQPRAIHMICNCCACGADSVHNRKLVIDTGTVRTAGSVDMHGTSHRSGSMDFTHYSGTQSVRLKSETDLSSRLRASRIQDIQSLADAILQPTLIEHRLPMAEVEVEGRTYRVMNPTMSLLEVARSLARGVWSTTKKIKEAQGGWRGKLMGTVSGVSSTVTGAVGNLHRYSVKAMQQQARIQEELRILDAQRSVCLRCGTLQ